MNPNTGLNTDKPVEVTEISRVSAVPGPIKGAVFALTALAATVSLPGKATAEQVHLAVSTDYTSATISEVELRQMYPDVETGQLQDVFTESLTRFGIEVDELRAAGKNIVPETGGQTILEVMEGLTPSQLTRVIAYYGAISNHPDSAAIEAIMQVVPEIGESRLEVDAFIDYEEEGVTGYDLLLEEEGISPEEAQINPRQFYTIGKILMHMYPDQNDEIADVLYELVFNDVGHFRPSTYEFMTAQDASGQEYLPLLEAYAQVIPAHFGELYQARLSADEAISSAAALADLSAAQTNASEAELEASENQLKESQRIADLQERINQALTGGV